ncbi:rRNA maturation RNase YbeY [Algoriphagus faecimaris]|uniref:Endoribonuclease YbeY n=1 Tax=Algoriphagus faecimaris TaxID=686796 RepID=A0A1G6TG08_9BACT|nr:rRNA maturation RNase YbeY [Algoriphagus faecimaris]SDD28092.1 rRNA maturation RNase YbeY [Algoriphagus faecimaris]
MAINFFSEDIDYNLPQKLKRKKWLKELAALEDHQIKELNYIFCSDEYLYQINVDYLQHDTYTDIITFDNSENKAKIEGDIFVSVDRIIENAERLDQPLEEELSRVISHGLFHLMGYKDKEQEEIKTMRNKELFAINLFKEI